MRVLFWGTPEFATPALRALIGEGFDVVGVVTQPDRPVGRSRSVLQSSPVKQIAIDEGIPVVQPERPRGDEFLAELVQLEPDLSVVVAYGHILPKSVIELPGRGTVNIHASLLPALRGAAPIQAAIRDGLVETGVTIMRMVPALDAGPIIFQARTPVLEDETYGELSLRLSELGALTLVEALSLMELGDAREQPQDDSLATYASKIDRAATWLDWSASAANVCRLIRSLDPKPGALTMLRGAEVKLFGARLAPHAMSMAPGQIQSIDDEGMVVACGEGAARVTVVQPAGKRRLTPNDWERGRGAAV
ncbi:MAG TPA: methionyl-tRNA formyltransferase, partial [Gemmatimonadaceae bacterium]|nr:methionyl-tRNA formyltransferase [Gemmatimonadaceae bacterium]